MGCVFRQTNFARKIDIVQLEPNVRAAIRNEIGELANIICVKHRFAILRIKDRQRDAPAALARDDPIGARFDRSRDSVFAPGGNPFHFLVNGVERWAAELVDANKKLLDVAEDDRRLRTPAVGIGVMKFLLAEEHAAFAQQIDDVDVGIEHVLACEILETRFVGEAAMIVDRRQNRQFVLPA